MRIRWSSREHESCGGVLAEDLPFLLAKEIGKEFSQKFSYKSLESICFVRGPGSYTGLRASLSVARGLRLACGGLGMYSVTSFQAGLLSAGFGGENNNGGGGYVLSLVESFRGIWYGQAFRGGIALGEACILGDDALRMWVFELLEMGGGELGLCGGGVGRACAGALGSFPSEAFVFGGDGNENGNKNGDVDAWAFSRRLVMGDDGMYARDEEALLPVYMGSPV